MSDVRTLNLSDPDEGMVSLNNNPSTNFVAEKPKKNVREYKDTMDSTPIADIMGNSQELGEPPMMAMDPRMMQPQQIMMTNPSPAITATKEVAPKKANPMNLTDDQMLALIVAACTAVAISKPVQEKLASSIPQFLNAQGSRSFIGLASTGAVAALLFYVARRYV